MLSIKVHRFKKKHGQKIKFNGRENARFDKKLVKCFNCKLMGHFSRECRAQGGQNSNNYQKYKSKEAGKDGSDSKSMVVVDGSIDWDKQTKGGNTEPRSLENFGMIAGIMIESDADSEGEVVLLMMPFLLVFQFLLVLLLLLLLVHSMRQSLHSWVFLLRLIDQAAQEKQELMTKLGNEIANQAKWNNSVIGLQNHLPMTFKRVIPVWSVQEPTKVTIISMIPFLVFLHLYLHLIKDCDLHEQRFAKRNAEGKGILGRRTTGKPVNPNRPKPFSVGQQNPVSTGLPNPVSVEQQNTDNSLRMEKAKDRGIVDSGCSRSMSGNKDKLEDFEDFDDGEVTFGGSTGKISGKGTIKTKNLNFENVLYEIRSCQLQEHEQTGKGVSRTNLTAGSPNENPANVGSQEDDSDSDDEPYVLIIYSTPTPEVPIVNEASIQYDGTKSDHAPTNEANLDEFTKLQSLQRQEQVGKEEADRLGLAFPSLNPILGVGSASIGSFVSAGSTPPIFAGSTPPLSPCASPIYADRHSISAGKHPYPAARPLVSVGRSTFAGRPTDSAGRPVSVGRPSGSAARTPVSAGRILGKVTESASSDRFPRASSVENSDIHDGLTIFNYPKSAPDWVEAMQAEMQQFRNQKVWVLVTLPEGKRAIGTKWILKNKRDARGIVCRNKARLVAQGHRQEEGIDYTDVFAPLARLEAIRLFLAFASFIGFKVYQMDMKSAFLYGRIAEEVYVTQPRGFEDPDHPNKVYKVVKALYGLHQAPRAWYERLSTFLLKHGYRRGTIYRTLFIKKNSKDIMLVQVYIDDIIFGSTRKDRCAKFETLMQSEFEMSSMGPLTFFLGLHVDQRPDGIFIHQEKSMIRCLMYLTATRQDIMFAVCAAARHQVTPKTFHLLSVKWIFKYLTAYLKLGLWYPRDSPFDLKAFCDSDYAGAHGDRKSTTGRCQFLRRRYALTANPTINASLVRQFWGSASEVSLPDGVKGLMATIDGNAYTVSEASIRSALQLDDLNAINTVTNAEIFDGLRAIGYATEGKFTQSSPPPIPFGPAPSSGVASTDPIPDIPSSSRPSEPVIKTITSLIQDDDTGGGSFPERPPSPSPVTLTRSPTSQELDALLDLANAALHEPSHSSNPSKPIYPDQSYEHEISPTSLDARRKAIADMKAKAKRDKPLTLAQQKEYMRAFVKNQSTAIYTTGWTSKDHHQQLKRSGETLESSKLKKLKSYHDTKQPAELQDTTYVSAGATIAAGDPISAVPSVSAAFSIPAETPIPAGVSTTAGVSKSASVPIIDLLDSPPKATSLPLDSAIAEQAVPLRKSTRKKSMAKRRTLPRPSQSESAALPFDEDDPEAKFKKANGIVKRFSTLRELMHWDQWEIRSWRFYALPAIHVLETKAGDIMYMFVDKKYPTLPTTIQRMLNHGLEIDRDPSGGSRMVFVYLLDHQSFNSAKYKGFKDDQGASSFTFKIKYSVPAVSTSLLLLARVTAVKQIVILFSAAHAVLATRPACRPSLVSCLLLLRESLPSVPDAYSQSLKALLSQSAASKSESHATGTAFAGSTQSIPRSLVGLAVELSLTSYLEPRVDKYNLLRGSISVSGISSLRSTGGGMCRGGGSGGDGYAAGAVHLARRSPKDGGDCEESGNGDKVGMARSLSTSASGGKDMAA
nr:putative ribonuclease H-like domain-containing protein [Tanacetum cinerariifolium]